MKALHQKRLLNVAKALRESKEPKAFTMAVFSSCGTPACALGHYAARRDLQKCFKLGDNAVRIHDNAGCEVASSDDEILQHFGIHEGEAEALFSHVGCDNAKTPKAAARYIERFVAEKKKALGRERKATK